MTLWEPTGGLGTGCALPTGGLGGFSGSSPYPVRRTGKVVVRKVAWPVRITVSGVEARGYIGQVEAKAGVGIEVQGVSASVSNGWTDPMAIQNPTEEELLVLLLLPQVGGST